MDLAIEHHPALLDLTAAAIRAKLRGVEPVAPEDIAPALLVPAGCFVSLHTAENDRLRGCIGSMDTSRPLLRALLHAAEAVLEDPRFTDAPVTFEELPRLTLELSFLSPLTSRAACLDFDLLNEGVYLTCAGRTGVFLPQVARQTGWTREQLLARLCTEKMGLPAIAWRAPDATLQTFTTLIVGPVPFPDEPTRG